MSLALLPQHVYTFTLQMSRFHSTAHLSLFISNIRAYGRIEAQRDELLQSEACFQSLSIEISLFSLS